MSSQRSYIPLSVRRQVEEDARQRCGYCLTPRHFTAKQLHIKHIVPLAAGGGSEIDNLWLACDLCNSYKGSRTHTLDPITRQTVPRFHPRQQDWFEHFTWLEGGLQIAGLTPTGRATVIALRLNNPFLIEARRWWIEANWHPPND